MGMLLQSNAGVLNQLKYNGIINSPHNNNNHTIHMKDWDDLRYFIAIARQGTVSGAARVLGVNYTTVIRRLNQLEERLGIALFNRQQSGYSLTEQGESLLARSARIEQEFIDLDRQLSGLDPRLSGTIRFDTTEYLATLLMPDFATFSKNHPAIELQIIANLETVSLAKRDADITLRATNTPPDNLIATQIGTITSNLYGAKSYLKQFEKPPNIDQLRWIGWDENYAGGSSARIVESTMPNDAYISCRVNNSTLFNAALKSGLGIGYMWCFLADADSDLIPVDANVAPIELGLWLLRHKDLASSQRLDVFSDFIAESITKKL